MSDTPETLLRSLRQLTPEELLPADNIYSDELLHIFVDESNYIERIYETSKEELEAHRRLLSTDTLTIRDVEQFVRATAGAPLRDRDGMNVFVGEHHPLPGGVVIKLLLEELLADMQAEEPLDPYVAHVRYETLHPFMDGNGRSGRALWLWQMLRQKKDPRPLVMGFLHLWYYQSLSSSRQKKVGTQAQAFEQLGAPYTSRQVGSNPHLGAPYTPRADPYTEASFKPPTK
ncbi:hypothetical protein CCP3SC15_730005 [Gammaproteobacteria bacterium]